MITKTISILFERSLDGYTKAYKINSYNPITAENKCIAVVDNPKTINPVKIKDKLTKLEHNSAYYNKYKLTYNNVLFKYGINVFLNNKQLDTDLFEYNKEDNTLILYIVLGINDIVVAEYNIDGIQYVFTTLNEHNIYNILPIVDQNTLSLGNHSIII